MYFCSEIGQKNKKKLSLLLTSKPRTPEVDLMLHFNVERPSDVCGVWRESAESDAELTHSHTADCPEVSAGGEETAGLTEQVHLDSKVSLAHGLFAFLKTFF